MPAKPATATAIFDVDVSDLWDRAQEMADATPLYRNSIKGKAANEVAAMGKLVGMRHLRECGVDYRRWETNLYDCVFRTPILDDEGTKREFARSAHGMRDLGVDKDTFETIKFRTKERKGTPKPHYDCSVPEHMRTDSTPDWHFFISLVSDGGTGEGTKRFTSAWLLGSIHNADLALRGKLWTPNEVDENGWRAKTPMWNVAVGDLVPPQDVYIRSVRPRRDAN